MQSNVYFICGIIGTGKSTMAKKMMQSNPNAVIISDNAIAEMLTNFHNMSTSIVMSKIIMSMLNVIIEEIVLGSEIKDLILDVDMPTPVERYAFMYAIRNKEKDLNKEGFFNLQFIYCIESDSGTTYRKNSRFTEDEWFDIYFKQVRRFSMPSEQELKQFSASMITVDNMR